MGPARPLSVAASLHRELKAKECLQGALSRAKATHLLTFKKQTTLDPRIVFCTLILS